MVAEKKGKVKIYLCKQQKKWITTAKEQIYTPTNTFSWAYTLNGLNEEGCTTTMEWRSTAETKEKMCKK